MKIYAVSDCVKSHKILFLDRAVAAFATYLLEFMLLAEARKVAATMFSTLQSILDADVVTVAAIKFALVLADKAGVYISVVSTLAMTAEYLLNVATVVTFLFYNVNSLRPLRLISEYGLC